MTKEDARSLDYGSYASFAIGACGLFCGLIVAGLAMGVFKDFPLLVP